MLASLLLRLAPRCCLALVAAPRTSPVSSASTPLCANSQFSSVGSTDREREREGREGQAQGPGPEAAKPPRGRRSALSSSSSSNMGSSMGGMGSMGGTGAAHDAEKASHTGSVLLHSSSDVPPGSLPNRPPQHTPLPAAGANERALRHPRRASVEPACRGHAWPSLPRVGYLQSLT